MCRRAGMSLEQEEGLREPLGWTKLSWSILKNTGGASQASPRFMITTRRPTGDSPSDTSMTAQRGKTDCTLSTLKPGSLFLSVGNHIELEELLHEFDYPIIPGRLRSLVYRFLLYGFLKVRVFSHDKFSRWYVFVFNSRQIS